MVLWILEVNIMVVLLIRYVFVPCNPTIGSDCRHQHRRLHLLLHLEDIPNLEGGVHREVPYDNFGGFGLW